MRMGICRGREANTRMMFGNEKGEREQGLSLEHASFFANDKRDVDEE